MVSQSKLRNQNEQNPLILKGTMGLNKLYKMEPCFWGYIVRLFDQEVKNMNLDQANLVDMDSCIRQYV